MAIEHASVRVVRKPWGVADLQPWSSIDGSGDAVGELWFQRAGSSTRQPALAAQAAVYQRAVVDPGSSGRCLCAFDRSAERQDRGMVHSVGVAGRAGCRWIETAHHATRIARARSGTARLPTSFNGARLSKGDVIFVPAGHHPRHRRGIVLAEIQQRSDATFRLFDYGRQRELHEDRRRRRFRRRAGSDSIRSTTPYRRANGSHRESRISSWSGSICPGEFELGAAVPIGRPGFLVLDGHAAIGLAARIGR